MCHHHVFSREYSHVCVSAVRDIETMAYRVLRYAKRIALTGCLLLFLSYALFNSQTDEVIWNSAADSHEMLEVMCFRH